MNAQRLDLLAEQVEIRRDPRMPLGARRVVIEMAVMAFREKVHVIHVSGFENARKFLRVELDAHIADGGAGVKIEMHLTKREFIQRWSVHGDGAEAAGWTRRLRTAGHVHEQFSRRLAKVVKRVTSSPPLCSTFP